jgi:acyl dehydratase
MTRVKSFAELVQGDVVTWRHAVTAAEVEAFARLSGDVNPLHLDDDFGRQRGFRGRVVHGAFVNALISRILGTQLPGPGCLWLSHNVRFRRPVYIDEDIDITVRVVHKSEALRTLALETTVTNSRGETLVTGDAKVNVLPDIGPAPGVSTEVELSQA